MKQVTFSFSREILKKIEGLKILVIGDIMVDRYIWGDAHRISPEAPVPVVAVEEESAVPGAAANVALNLRALGISVELCGIYGTDPTGRRLRDILVKNGITMSESFARDGLDTIMKTRVIVRHQQLCRLDREEPPAKYRVEWPLYCDMFEKRIKDADAVIISDYAKGVVSEELVDGIREYCTEHKKIMALDPKPRHRLQFKGVDILTPNRSEALKMVGMDLEMGEEFPAEEVAKRIWEKHEPKYCIISLGANGLLICQEGKIVQHMPTLMREVFDVSGAGDTVAAMLTAVLAAGAPIGEAAQLANAAAGVVVSKLGTAVAEPEEIIEQIELFEAHAGDDE